MVYERRGLKKHWDIDSDVSRIKLFKLKLKIACSSTNSQSCIWQKWRWWTQSDLLSALPFCLCGSDNEDDWWWLSEPSPVMMNGPPRCWLRPSATLRRTPPSPPVLLLSRAWLPQHLAVVSLLHALIMIKWSESPWLQLNAKQIIAEENTDVSISTTAVQVLTGDSCFCPDNHHYMVHSVY